MARTRGRRRASQLLWTVAGDTLGTVSANSAGLIAAADPPGPGCTLMAIRGTVMVNPSSSAGVTTRWNYAILGLPGWQGLAPSDLPSPQAQASWPMYEIVDVGFGDTTVDPAIRVMLSIASTRIVYVRARRRFDENNRTMYLYVWNMSDDSLTNVSGTFRLLWLVP